MINSGANTITLLAGLRSPQDCQFACQSEDNCSSFVYREEDGQCMLKDGAADGQVAEAGIVLGPKQCGK